VVKKCFGYIKKPDGKLFHKKDLIVFRQVKIPRKSV
jgi:hypothetical protein